MSTLIKGTPEYNSAKEEALSICGVPVTENFNPKEAVRDRVDYLKEFLRTSGRKAFVLGISGGVDSTTVGRLSQIAVEELRSEGYEAQFVAMRLPAGIQKDEDDAQAAIEFINPDRILTVNVGEAANIMSLQGVEAFEKEDHKLTPETVDFHKGNIKARLRMIAQYQAAAFYQGVVIGTDHNAEYVTAFYTRFGDEACDLTVLNGLNKRQVRLVAKELGAPAFLYEKVPTADLEELHEQKTDDEGFGFPYYKLDDFLEGKQIDDETEALIVNRYHMTQFKRKPIHGFKSVQKMRDCVVTMPVTGPCELNLVKACKLFNKYTRLSKYAARLKGASEDEYTLCEYNEKDERTLRITISESDALNLIYNLQLKETHSDVFNFSSTFHL